MEVKIPKDVQFAAKIVLKWLQELQGQYDPNLASGDLNSYYDSVQVIADEEELEFYTEDE